MWCSSMTSLQNIQFDVISNAFYVHINMYTRTTWLHIRLVKIKIEVELIPTGTFLRYNERLLCPKRHIKSPKKIRCRFATQNYLKSCFTSHKLCPKSPPHHGINTTSSKSMSGKHLHCGLLNYGSVYGPEWESVVHNYWLKNELTVNA